MCVLWKLNIAVQMCPIPLRRKAKLFTQPIWLLMTCTHSLCLQPHSHLPLPQLTPLHTHQLPFCSSRYQASCCLEALTLAVQRSALSWQSVLCPSREAIPDHPHLTPTTPLHSLRHTLSPYTALLIIEFIKNSSILEIISFICSDGFYVSPPLEYKLHESRDLEPQCLAHC